MGVVWCVVRTVCCGGEWGGDWGVGADCVDVVGDRAGGERAAVNSVWRAQLESETQTAREPTDGNRSSQRGGSRLKASAQRNLRKTELQHLVSFAQRERRSDGASS